MVSILSFFASFSFWTVALMTLPSTRSEVVSVVAVVAFSFLLIGIRVLLLLDTNFFGFFRSAIFYVGWRGCAFLSRRVFSFLLIIDGFNSFDNLGSDVVL